MRHTPQVEHEAKVLGPRDAITKQFRVGLSAHAAQEETAKAAIMTHQEIVGVMEGLDTLRDKVALYVAVRTACRVDELLELCPAVITLGTRAVYIHWAHRTKGTKLKPHRPDTYVELRRPHSETAYTYPVSMRDVVGVIKRVAEGEGVDNRITTLSYKQWLARLKAANPEASGHSLKRTATTRAVAVVA